MIRFEIQLYDILDNFFLSKSKVKKRKNMYICYLYQNLKFYKD